MTRDDAISIPAQPVPEGIRAALRLQLPGLVPDPEPEPDDSPDPEPVQERAGRFGLATLGGPGSGNFGHSGRPGSVGGSTPASGYHGAAGTTREFYHGTSVEIAEQIKTEGLKPLSWDKKAYASTQESVALAYAMGIQPSEGRHNPDDEVAVVVIAKEAGQQLFRVDPSRPDSYVTSRTTIPPSLIKEVRIYKRYGGGNAAPVRVLDAASEGDIYLAFPLSALRTAGGPGSGNFGHAGRPGLEGGSAQGDRPAYAVGPGPFFVASSGLFDFQAIKDRRFLYNPKTDELAIGADQTDGNISTHADVIASLGFPPATYDRYTIHGHIGDNVLTITTYDGDEVERSDALHALYEKINRNRGNRATRVVFNNDYAESISNRLLIDLLRTLGGPGSGHFGHAGRPGAEGGSAPGRLSFKSLGLPTTGNELYTHVGIQLEWDSPILRSDSTWTDATPNADAAMQGIFEALNEDPTLLPLLKQQLKVSFTGDATEPGVMLTVINSKNPGNLGLILNTHKQPRSETVQNLGPGNATVIKKLMANRFNVDGFDMASAKRSRAFYNGDADPAAAVRMFYHGVTTHEIGHMIESIYNKRTGGRLAAEVAELARASRSISSLSSLRHTISDYAVDGGPQEMWAEMYAARRLGAPLPKKMQNFVDRVVTTAVPLPKSRVQGGPRGRTLEGDDMPEGWTPEGFDEWLQRRPHDLIDGEHPRGPLPEPEPEPELETLGGPGSGNFGHSGRPGSVGGSGRDPRGPDGAVIREPSYGDAMAAMQREMDELEAQGRDPMEVFGGETTHVSLYHGTTREALDSIRDHGLMPGKREGADAYAKEHDLVAAEWRIGDRAASIYMTSSLEEAHFYAKLVAKRTGGRPVILEIDVPIAEASTSLVADEASALPHPGLAEFVDFQETAARYNGRIPPEWITNLNSKKRRAAAEADASTVAIYAVFFADADEPETLGGRFGMKALGGPGSGNFGHAGRPGMEGGSAPQTATPEFKAWFGDSKIVTADGAPLRVFHGTSDLGANDEGIEEFSGTEEKSDHSRWLTVAGDWFTDDPEVADYFARGRPGGTVYPVFLKIEKPFIVDTYEDLEDALRGSGKTVQGFVSHLRLKGYDGIVVEDAFTDIPKSRRDFVTFESTQVKSAIGNRGTFNPKRRLITMGGPGSGNFGHAGRPGVEGGSSPRRPAAFYIPLIFTSFKALGGPGSGNFDHAGRPGAVGGSARNFHGTTIENAVLIKTEGLKPLSDGRVFTSGKLDQALNWATLRSKDRAGQVVVVVLKPEAKALFSRHPTVKHANVTREHVPPEFIKEVRIYSATDIRNRRGLFPNQKGGSDLLFRLLDADEDVLFVFPIAAPLRAAGGPGSGNFGHAGRPGIEGGSAPADSFTIYDHVRALHTYTAGGELNLILRNDLVNDSVIDAKEQTVEKLDHLLDSQKPLAKGTILHRIVDHEFADSLKPGDVFRDHGFVSTTEDARALEDIAEEALGSAFSEVRRIRIVVNGPHVRGVRINDVFSNPNFFHQREVLLERGLTFVVESVTPELIKLSTTKGVEPRRQPRYRS